MGGVFIDRRALTNVSHLSFASIFLNLYIHVVIDHYKKTFNFFPAFKISPDFKNIFCSFTHLRGLGMKPNFLSSLRLLVLNTHEKLNVDTVDSC